MTFDPKLIAWLFFSLLSVVILSRMMNKRRAQLGQLLQSYVEERVQWAKKRAKAARLTQQLARKEAAEEAILADAMQPAHSTRSPQGAPVAPVAAESREAAVPVGSSL